VLELSRTELEILRDLVNDQLEWAIESQMIEAVHTLDALSFKLQQMKEVP
jgi:hypothetical protein